jgi:hypothetical protein
MASERVTVIICKAFISQFVDGEEMWTDISMNLQANGITASFSKKDCLELLLIEWTIARFAWLYRQSEKITNSITKGIMLKEIKNQFDEVFQENEFKRLFANYYLLSDSYDKNELDSLGLRMGPGPLILQRYLVKIKHDFLSSEEEMTIMIEGDRSCWYLEKSLNEVLESILITIK